MKSSKIISLMVISIIMISSILFGCCPNDKVIEYEGGYIKLLEKPSGDEIDFEGVNHSVEEICLQIIDVINHYMYNERASVENVILDKKDSIIGKEDFVGKSFEFELFYVNNVEQLYLNQNQHLCEIVFTNHPIKDDQGEEYYTVQGYTISNIGISSEMYSQRYVKKNELEIFRDKNEYTTLGKYSVTIESVYEPHYEELDNEFKNKLIASIKKYFDEGHDSLFADGEYHIYINGWFSNDTDLPIHLVHENGDLYWCVVSNFRKVTGENSAGIYRVVNESERYSKKFNELVSDNPSYQLIIDNAIITFLCDKGS